MKRKTPLILRPSILALAAVSIPAATLAQTTLKQTTLANMLPVEMSLAAYLIIAFLLVFSIMMFFLFQHRFNKAATELKGVTAELGGTRQRLVETNRQLDVSQKEHKATEQRYQGILFDAKTGMFQMDLAGKCTYLNTAMQEMSGLYPKKALKEGLASAIHPDDREDFHAAWRAFADRNQEFDQVFRFCHAKGREVHVSCRVNKVYNAKKEVESYIGWTADVTKFHAAQLQERAATARYEHFVGETIEGFYKLAPPAPIALKGDLAKMSEAIMESFVLVDCNDTFAALYGKKARDLLGKSINELKDGIGAFKNNESIKDFIQCGYKAIDLESIRQDPSGNRLNLMNNVIGIVEDNMIAGIWGSQRNNSRQKREKTELSNKVQFMQRILNALPADVHVKDTRCRYLYASQKLADRTGIPQEEWVGKTIFEVMPATPRDHDQTAIETMKSSTLCRIERPYEARGKSGWMETVQIPLVSDEGLVEGVVGLSLEISERKKKEEEARHMRGELETQLKHTQGELTKSRNEYGKTAASLSDAIQQLKIAEAEKTNREHEFKFKLSERKRAEEILRRNEEGLLSRQQQLEEQLAKRLARLDAETDKRKMWEELLSIKEDELRKAENLACELNEHHGHETNLREQAEASLEASQTALAKVRRELEELAAKREDEIHVLNDGHTTRFDAEHRARSKAENELTKVREALESTQEQVKRMTEQHAEELEKEVEERKTAAEKLIQSMGELDELRQQFSLRIEEETKSIKRELAQKQIREKALRRHEKDLENRIMELEQALQDKTQAYTEQIQAREGAETEKQQLEQKMEQLTLRQQQLVNRETEKLNLNIAEIRLDEVKLRKRANDLEQAKEVLEETLQQRDAELEKAQQDILRTEALLADTQASLKQLSNDQSKVIAKETEELKRKINALEKRDNELRGQLSELTDEKGAIENKLESRNGDLTKAAREYRKIVDAYKATQARLKQLADSQDTFVAKRTESLKGELEQLRKSEKAQAAQEQQLQRQIEAQQQNIHKLAGDLQAETEGRKDAEMALKKLQARYADSRQDAGSRILMETRDLTKQIEEYRQNENTLMQQLETADKAVQQRDHSLAKLQQEREQTAEQLKDAEQKLATTKQEHQAELKMSLAEVQEISRMNSTLVDEVNETVQSSLNPVLKTTVIMEQAENLSNEQKMELANANHQCRSLIGMMEYRKELTHLADGSDVVAPAKCDLHALMADIDHQFCHRAKTNKLFFAISFAQYQASHNVPRHVTTDADKLRKTLAILLGYAIDRTKKGRIGLHASRKSADSSGMVIAFELTFTPTAGGTELLSGIFDSEVEGVVDLKHGLTLARRYIGMLGGETRLEHRDAGIIAITIDFPFTRTGSEIVMPSKEKEDQAAGAA
jgi:PAS domain S-box-containing protein